MIGIESQVAMASLFQALHLHLNQTSHGIQLTLNQTGNSLAESVSLYHNDVRQIGSFLSSVPFHVLVFMHGLYTAAAIRPLPFRPYWLLCFWISLMAGYGGGTITCLLLKEPFIWLKDDLVLPIFGFAWWLIMYSPWDIGLTLFKLAPVKLVCRSSAAILRARVIMARIEMALRSFSPKAIVAPLFFGTLAGCGGRMMVDIASHVFGPSQKPPELLHPSWLLRSGLIISTLYMSSVHWLHVMPQDVAYVLVITLLVGHAVMEEALGGTVDLTAPLGSLFHSVTSIPRPLPSHNKKMAKSMTLRS